MYRCSHIKCKNHKNWPNSAKILEKFPSVPNFWKRWIYHKSYHLSFKLLQGSVIKAWTRGNTLKIYWTSYIWGRSYGISLVLQHQQVSSLCGNHLLGLPWECFLGYDSFDLCLDSFLDSLLWHWLWCWCSFFLLLSRGHLNVPLVLPPWLQAALEPGFLLSLLLLVTAMSQRQKMHLWIPFSARVDLARSMRDYSTAFLKVDSYLNSPHTCLKS